MTRILAAALVFLALAGVARAVEPDEMLANPALEARARAIGKELRCLVCQNESIDDSNATLAHDLRVILRERLVAGDTDQQAIQYIVDRYGQFVLLKPPVEPATYALWFGPACLLLLAGVGTVLYLRRHRPGPAEAPLPLDPGEARRVAELLGEGEG
ncbi:MAG TPA: cytochrome c-type biogenesis protein [Stellaceae bacterium]|nr:cytochrome c-type biogenesis protein [Stellaceae bacterium]